MRYGKLASFALLSTLLFGFTACGEDDEEKVKDKKILVIYSRASKGLCESKFFRDTLENQGFKGVKTQEVDGYVTCSDMGRNANNCVAYSLNTGSETCLVGVDGMR